MKIRKPAKPLNQLEEAHAALYRDFLPTLDKYQEMAKQALDLQIDIAKARFAKSFPHAQQDELVLIATFSARETPAKLGQLLDAVAEKNIEVEQIVYDPMHFAFYLFGKS